MNTKLLVESAPASPTKTGNRWRVIVARPGQGSSGFYSESVLKDFGPSSLAAGAKAFVEHDPKRPVEKMIGTFPEGGYWDETEKALVAELDVFPHWKDFVEAVAPHTGMSIYMMGESDDEGNVTQLIPHRQNGADLVSYEGLEGSGIAEKLYESAIQHDSEKPSAASVQEKEKEKMELEQIVSDLAATVNTFIASQTSGQKAEAQAEVDAEAIATATATAVEAYDAKIALIDSERDTLTESQVTSLRLAAKAGSDVAPLIESAKATAEEFKTKFESQNTGDGEFGRLFESSASTNVLDLGKVL